MGYLSLASELTNILVPVVTAVWAIWGKDKVNKDFIIVERRVIVKLTRSNWSNVSLMYMSPIIVECIKFLILQWREASYFVVTHVTNRYLPMMSQGVTIRYQAHTLSHTQVVSNTDHVMPCLEHKKPIICHNLIHAHSLTCYFRLKIKLLTCQAFARWLIMEPNLI